MENLIPTQPLTGIFQTLSSLSLSDLDQVMKEVIGLRKQKLPGVLSLVEADLLKKINKPVPYEIQQRYNNLVNLRNGKKLTDIEHQELLELTSYTENFNVNRLENILQLANLRNISLDDLLEQLELKTQPNVV
jgi:hypothetical protein